MSYYKTYNDETEYDEPITMDNIILNNCSEQEIADFLIVTGLISDSNVAFVGNMEKLIFTVGDDNEIYSNSEIEFIEEVNQVYVFQEYYLPLASGVMPCRVIAVETNCFREDNIYFCIAFEKIINKALGGFNIFLFIAEDGIIFGCRIFNKENDYDCALSKIICDDFTLEQIQYELSFLQDAVSFSQFYSLFIGIISNDDETSDFEELLLRKRGIQSSYVETLSDIEKELGIDTSKELKRYKEFFVPQNEESFKTIVEDVEESLSFIKSNRVNTYELLFEADKAEQLASDNEKRNEALLEQDNSISGSDVNETTIPSELLDDPAAMIQFLKKKKGL